MNTRQTILVSIAILLVGALAVWWYLGFSLDFMRFFAADPGVVETTAVSPSPSVAAQAPASVVVSCSPDTQSVKIGAPAELLGFGGNNAYEWFAPTGTPGTATGKSFSVTYDAVGTKQVTVQSQRGDGSGNVDSVQCTVEVTP
jgi:hypothetical protein